MYSHSTTTGVIWSFEIWTVVSDAMLGSMVTNGKISKLPLLDVLATCGPRDEPEVHCVA